MRRRRRVQAGVTADELAAWKRSHAALEHAAGTLQARQRAGQATIAVADVLALLGLQQAPPAAAGRDPLDDELTGTRWPGPPGTLPPR